MNFDHFVEVLRFILQTPILCIIRFDPLPSWIDGANKYSSGDGAAFHARTDSYSQTVLLRCRNSCNNCEDGGTGPGSCEDSKGPNEDVMGDGKNCQAWKDQQMCDQGGAHYHWGQVGRYQQTLTGSFSVVSKPMFATRCAARCALFRVS